MSKEQARNLLFHRSNWLASTLSIGCPHPASQPTEIPLFTTIPEGGGTPTKVKHSLARGSNPDAASYTRVSPWPHGSKPSSPLPAPPSPQRRIVQLSLNWKAWQRC